MKTIATGTTAISVASASSGLKILSDWPPPPTAGLNDGVDGEQVPEPDGDRVLVRVREHDVGQEEVVPVGDEAEEEDERHDRLRERQRDAHERLQLAAAVDARGVEKPRRECGRVVEVREVDAEREERERQDDRERAPDQMHGVQLEEDRQHERGPGHDHHDQRQREDELPAREPADREPVPRRNRHHKRDRRRGERVVQRVDDPAAVDVVAERVQMLPRERDVVEVPNANGLLVMSAWSLFVGARMSQTIGAMKKIANVEQDRTARALSPSTRTCISRRS